MGSSEIAVARRIAGCARSMAMAESAASAPGRPSRPAWMASAQCGSSRRRGPNQVAMCRAAQACGWPVWQDVQASGAPICAATSGRGRLKAWSRR
jgi:hypothetical protein